jgi:hypothetical protein
MKSTPVDPRDTSWEVDYPMYRVFIWSPLPGPPPNPPLAQGWRSMEFDVTEADIDEVLAWAREQTPSDGTFTVWVRGENNGAPGLYRVAGWEPTRMEEPPSYVG